MAESFARKSFAPGAFTPKRIVVTGASRGIGRGLAEALAGPGVTLALVGRDRAALAESAAACRARGATVEEIALDVREREALAAAFRDFDARGPVDLVIANAGIALRAAEIGLAEASYREIDVNLVGALNTLLPLIPAMTERRSGRILLVSSIAAFAPLPTGPSYSASKAALLSYGLGLRDRLHRHGVVVNVACPGYVETALGETFGKVRPLSMSVETAARRILDGLRRDMPVNAFPRRLATLAKLSRLVPERLRRLGMSVLGLKAG